MKRRKIKIAVTGGIGSGKSVAVNALKNAGYNVISCDEENAKLLKKRAVLKKIKQKFPTVVTGKLFLSLDKKALSKEVFGNESKRKTLTDLLHPLIMRKVEKKANKSNGVSFVEVPLLFESGLEKDFDGVIVICAKTEDRIMRVKERSNLTREEIEGRIAAQFDYEKIEKDKYCVIFNDKDLTGFEKDVLKQAKELIQSL